MASLAPYNISLTSSSPTFIYAPFRDGWYALDGDPQGGWRSSFSNITDWPNPGLDNVGTGVPLRETYLDGATVTMQFEGTAVYLCLTAVGSSFTFTVDDSPISTTGPATEAVCGQSGGQVIVCANGLPYGNHTATVRVNSQGNADFSFYGGIVTVGLNGTAPVEQRIDDDDPGWIYEPDGVWIYSSPSSNDTVGDYNATRHWMCSYGPSYTASYTFNGSSAVQLLGMLNLNIGPYTVQLDGQSYVYNGSDLWRESQQVLFYRGALDPTKEYTITLINYDQAAPDAQQPVGPDFYPCATVDELVLTKTTPKVVSGAGAGNSTSSTPGSGTSPGSGSGSGSSTTAGSNSGSSSTGAIAGAVVGGVAALCIAAFILWLFLRRKRRIVRTASGMAEINPRPNVPPTEVTPYILPHSDYGPLPTEDSTREAQDEKQEDTTNATSPMGPTISTNSSPFATARRGPARQADKSATDRSAITSQPWSSQFIPSTQTSPVSASTNQAPSQDPSSERPDITGASTQVLVSILNQRLRNEYRAENEDYLEPPSYEPVE